MDNIIFAKFVPRIEVDDFIKAIQKKNELNFIKSKSYLENHKEEVINSYKELDSKFESLRQQYISEHEARVIAYESDCCACGSDLIYIESHNFWGCKNYLNKDVYHFNFRGGASHHLSNYLDKPFDVSVGQWVSTIKHMSGLPNTMKISAIFKFLIDNGFCDLAMKYCNESTIEKVNNYRGAFKKGTDFELEAKDMLLKMHKNLYYQQPIKYQYHERQQMYAIPDFIAVEDDRVVIYECKYSEDLIDDMQKDLYIRIISFIMNQKNMSEKELSFKYIFHENGIPVIS